MNLPSRQRLPKGLLSVLLVLLNMFIPLSMDLYLPALPNMGVEFGVSSEWVNFTLSGFFFFYALGALLFGPLSDKHGRRRLLIAVLLTYIVSSLACAVAPGIVLLIVSRGIQGVAAGGISTLAMAIIKDSYEGKARTSALALTQTVGGLAPMLAPLVGTWIMAFADWRMTFVVLALIGAVALVLALVFSESLGTERRFVGSLGGALARLGAVLQAPQVLWPVVIFSLGMLPFLGYITASAYIYIDQFHFTREQYSLFFAGNAFLSMVAPMLYIKWGTSLDRRRFAVVAFSASLAAGLGLILFGSASPAIFFALFAVNSLVTTSMRPFSTNFIFDQHAGDNGSLASILGTSTTIVGSLGMVLVSIPSSNRAELLGVLTAICAILSLVGWLVLLKSRVELQGVKPQTKRA